MRRRERRLRRERGLRRLRRRERIRGIGIRHMRVVFGVKRNRTLRQIEARAVIAHTLAVEGTRRLHVLSRRKHVLARTVVAGRHFGQRGTRVVPLIHVRHRRRERGRLREVILAGELGEARRRGWEGSEGVRGSHRGVGGHRGNLRNAGNHDGGGCVSEGIHRLRLHPLRSEAVGLEHSRRVRHLQGRNGGAGLKRSLHIEQSLLRLLLQNLQIRNVGAGETAHLKVPNALDQALALHLRITPQPRPNIVLVLHIELFNLLPVARQELEQILLSHFFSDSRDPLLDFANQVDLLHQIGSRLHITSGKKQNLIVHHSRLTNNLSRLLCPVPSAIIGSDAIQRIAATELCSQRQIIGNVEKLLWVVRHFNESILLVNTR